MSSSIREVVQVSITKETTGISRVGFGIPLLISREFNWNKSERVRFYSDPASLVPDVVGGVNSKTYKAMTAVFSQNPRVMAVAVGCHDSGAESVVEALNLMREYNSGFYGLVLIERSTSDALQVAEWADANFRIFAYASDESAIINHSLSADTASIAKQLYNAKRENTFLFYHQQASSEYIDAGFLGVILPLDAGSYTAKFKTIIGATANFLSGTQKYNAMEKRCNVYTEIGGRNIVMEGTAPSGSFIDITIFVHWLTARIQESVYSVLVNSKKVPYTEQGILTIANALEVPLKMGQDRGAISPDLFDDDGIRIGGYEIITPDFASIPASDKQDRVLRDVRFKAFLSGAIHKVMIDGVVTL